MRELLLSVLKGHRFLLSFQCVPGAYDWRLRRAFPWNDHGSCSHAVHPRLDLEPCTSLGPAREWESAFSPGTLCRHCHCGVRTVSEDVGTNSLMDTGVTKLTERMLHDPLTWAAGCSGYLTAHLNIPLASMHPFSGK